MATGSADCIVTSPPYWAKRDYRVVGQYGHEPDPAGYVATLRATFREARRVLADDGTCWLNLGDSYSAGGNSPTGPAHLPRPAPGRRHAPGMGTKNLLGLPWRVALALQDDGWILRNAIIWHKPNAMPESVRDRMSCRYELSSCWSNPATTGSTSTRSASRTPLARPAARPLPRPASGDRPHPRHADDARRATAPPAPARRSTARTPGR